MLVVAKRVCHSYRLLGALIAYFVIGAVIMKVKYNAAGSDIIPQKAFWFALPLLIKVKLVG